MPEEAPRVPERKGDSPEDVGGRGGEGRGEGGGGGGKEGEEGEEGHRVPPFLGHSLPSLHRLCGWWNFPEDTTKQPPLP